MKIYYFNDSGKSQNVYTHTLYGTGYTLTPASFYFFELDLKEGEAPFIKVWENGQILISTIKDETLVTDDLV